MILVYKPYTDAEIKDILETSKPQIIQWFKDNPQRRVCHAKVFYNKIFPIRKNHLDEDLEAAAKEARKS